jgi:hypothetical protein
MSVVPSSRIPSWPTARRVPLRVAMLAQQSEVGDDHAGTDVMIYRQPASDVPVPCDWRQSPVDPATSSTDDAADIVDAEPRAESAPLSSTLDSAQLLHQAMSADARLYVWMCSGVVTCTLAAWVALG